MPPGIPKPARRRAERSLRPRPTRGGGASTFAENPATGAPQARIIWRADLDPETLAAVAVEAAPSDPDALDRARLQPWLAVAVDDAGEHAVLSDGCHHLRLDIEAGSLLSASPIVLHYRIAGLGTAHVKLAPLRRFIDLVRFGRFAPAAMSDPRIIRHVLVLRVRDALAAGASQREIARAIFGEHDRDDPAADALRSRVRRLVREARRLQDGAWRDLMRRQAR